MVGIDLRRKGVIGDVGKSKTLTALLFSFSRSAMLWRNGGAGLHRGGDGCGREADGAEATGVQGELHQV